MNNRHSSAAIKALSSVEVDRWASNQHEFHGTSALKRIFGYDRRTMNGEFFYIQRSGAVLRSTGRLTWYDARENDLNRSEFRFYYTDNPAVRNAKEGDVLAVSMCEDNVCKIIIVERGTQFIDVLAWRLGLDYIDERYQLVDNMALLASADDYLI